MGCLKKKEYPDDVPEQYRLLNNSKYMYSQFVQI